MSQLSKLTAWSLRRELEALQARCNDFSQRLAQLEAEAQPKPLREMTLEELWRMAGEDTEHCK